MNLVTQLEKAWLDANIGPGSADPDKIADFLLSHININVEESQKLLELENYSDLLKELFSLLIKESEAVRIKSVNVLLSKTLLNPNLLFPKPC